MVGTSLRRGESCTTRQAAASSRAVGESASSVEVVVVEVAVAAEVVAVALVVVTARARAGAGAVAGAGAGAVDTPPVGVGVGAGGWELSLLQVGPLRWAVAAKAAHMSSAESAPEASSSSSLSANRWLGTSGCEVGGDDVDV